MGNQVSRKEEREIELLQKQFGWPEPQWLKSLVKWQEENKDKFNYYWLYHPSKDASNSNDDDGPKGPKLVERALDDYCEGRRSTERCFFFTELVIFAIRMFYGLSPFYSYKYWRYGPQKAFLASSAKLPAQSQTVEEDYEGGTIPRDSNGFPPSGGDLNSCSTHGSDGNSSGPNGSQIPGVGEGHKCSSLSLSRRFCVSLMRMRFKHFVRVVQVLFGWGFVWYLARIIRNEVIRNRIKGKITQFISQRLGRVKGFRSLPN